MKFQKVSFEQYLKDYLRFVYGYEDDQDLPEGTIEFVKSIYNDIKLPKRGTKKSAGYDFFIPYDCYFNHKKEVMIPTGIKFECDDDKWLMCVPRSGLGIKYGMALRNTVGVIDADYFNNENNEGHIMAKVTCDEDFTLEKGKGLFQAIISHYYVVDDEKDDLQERQGGFGSTGM